MSEFPIERRNLLKTTGTGIFATIEGVQISNAEWRETMDESVIFQEDFEDYSPGEIPPSFVLAGNNNQGITNTESAIGAQSYQMNGSPGGCWQAIMRRELFSDSPRSNAICFQGYFRAGDGDVGCHDDRGEIRWRTVDSPDWGDGSGELLMKFMPDGEVRSAGSVVGEYEPYEWTAFEIEYYWDENTSEVTHKCKIGDGPTETVTRNQSDDEMEFTVLELKSGDFTVFWDEIVVTEIDETDPGPDIGVLTGAVTNRDGDSLANVTLEFVPTGTDIPEETTTTDDSGNYEVELPADDYEIVIEEEGFGPVSIPVSVEAGETSTVNIELIPENLAPVASALEQYRSSIKSSIYDQITLWAQYEANAINEFGEGYTTGLTNYWEYRAGSKSADEVPVSLLAVMETLAGEAEKRGIIDESDLEMADFVQELYSAVNTDDPSVEKIHNYYLGTANGQSNYLTINGLTIAEVIETFDNKFEDTIDNMIDILEDDEFTQADIQRTIDRILRRTNQINKSQSEATASITDAQELLLSDQEIEAQFFAQDVERPTESDGVSPRFAVTGTIGGLAIIKAVAGAAAGSASTAVGYGTVLGTGTAAKGLTGAAVGASSLYLGGQVTSGANLASVSKQQLLQQQMASRQLQYKTFQEASKKSAEELANEIKSLATDIQITELELQDITESNAETLGLLEDILNLFPFIDINSTTVGTQTGTVTIKNTGSTVVGKLTAETDFQVYSENNSEFIDVDLKAEFPDLTDITPLNPGESATVEFTYEVPYEQFGSTFNFSISLFNPIKYDATFGAAPDLFAEPLATAEGVFTAGETGESISTSTIAEETIAKGDTETFTYEPDAEATELVVETDWDDYNIDLHLYDEDGNHTGYNYEEETIEEEIPESTHSGRVVSANGREWIIISELSSEEYDIEIISPDVADTDHLIRAPEQRSNKSMTPASVRGVRSSTIETDYKVGTIDVPNLPARFVNSPSKVLMQSVEGTIVEKVTQIGELNGDEPLTNVTIQWEDLEHADTSKAIDASRLQVSKNNFDIGAGGSETVTLSVDIPEGQQVGLYAGQVNIESEEDTLSAVAVVQVTPRSVVENLPRDLDDDGYYEDIDGDGEFDIFDVQALFNGLESDAVQNNPEAFNFNADENPEEVTIFDVQGLFNEL